MKKALSLLFGIFYLFSVANAQTADSTLNFQKADSLIFNSDSLSVSDSLSIADSLAKKEKKFDVDAVVFSKASDSLKFDVVGKKMHLFGSGDLKYKSSELSAGSIDVNFVNNELSARGVIDTSDTTGEKYIQTPVLTENGESYEGKRLKYNFKTQQGFISVARNDEESSRYEGNKVKKVDKNTFFIEDGIYTTCSNDVPHTYFSAAKMKVIQNDKVFAEWIFLHIAGVPLPIPLPWAVFPNKSGRRSGIVVPTYGQMADRGQYFRNFGYFWAMSDYMDFGLFGDYYSKGGWGLRSRYRYKLRYKFDGNLSAGISKITLGEPADPNYSEGLNWDLKLYHSQRFNPSSSLNINLQYSSSDYLKQNSVSYNNLLRQDIISNATYSKRWDSGWSMQLNYNRNQNLQSGNITETLPSISVTKSTFYPFDFSKGKSATQKSWYEQIAMNYSGNAKYYKRKTSDLFETKWGAQHSLKINASPKIGYFNITPSISYSEKWYPKRQVYEVYQYQDSVFNAADSSYTVTTRDSTRRKDIDEWNFVRNFDFSVSASTKLYGMARPNMLGIEAFRHTFTPSISYNYRPDFSDQKWGYYDSYEANGQTFYYDKFGNGIYGGVPTGESQSLNFSVGNLFEIKTMKDPTDTTSESKKIRLLNFTASTGYNFAADSLQLADLRLSYRTQIGEWLNFNGSSSYSFYDQINGRKIKTFLKDAGKGLMRMTNLSLSFSTTISGEKLKGEEAKKGPGFEEERYNEEDGGTQIPGYVAIQDQQQADFSIPWSLSLNYNYNLNKSNPEIPSITQNLGLNLSFNLTKNWKFTVRGNYDIEEGRISAPAVSVYRDLHCWEMNFDWYPIGTYRGFRFEIRIKAPELQDIKVEKAGGLYSGR